MGCFDLTAGFIVQLLLFQCLHLCLGQDAAFLGNLDLQCFQAGFETSRDIALQCPAGQGFARSCRSQIDRTPEGETNTPNLRSSFEVRA